MDGIERNRGERSRERLPRREFLRRGVAAGLAVSGLPMASVAAPRTNEAPAVRRRVRLGATELEISDISFGGSRLRDDPDLVRYAFDRGIRYFDTAEGYTGGRSERVIGEALQGRRDRVVLGSKVKAGSRTRRDTLMQRLEESLRRLRTDRIDIYFNHAVNDLDRLRNPEWTEFAARAKQQGKIRYSGISGHGGKLAACLELALEEGLTDVILVAYNFGQDPAFYERLLGTFDFIALQPELPRLLAKAKRQGVGVIAMKTLLGGRLNDLRAFEREGSTFAQAAFRWVLSDPDVDALIVSMTSREQIDEYLGASGSRPVDGRDSRLLERYLGRNGRTLCRPACDACQAACPHGVPIADVLRARMYALDYGDADLARDAWAQLGGDPARCLTCREPPCLGTCPWELEIPALTRASARLLSDASATRPRA